MNTDMLLKEFQGMLALEQKAKRLYDHYIDQIGDEEIKKRLISIRNDEAVHIEIAKKLIEYVS